MTNTPKSAYLDERPTGMSQAPATFTEKVCAVMADVGAVRKDKVNPHFKYGYVSAEALRSRVQKACAHFGLVLRITYSNETVTAQSSVMKCSVYASDDGKDFVHLGDGWGAGLDKSEKSPMKACTSAAKYALSNAFCIPLGEDADPEADGETDREAEEIQLSPEYLDLWRALQEAKPCTDGEVANWLKAVGARIRDLEKQEQVAMWDTLKDVCGCGAEAKAAGRTAVVTVAVLQGLWKRHVMPENYGKHEEKKT